MEKHNFPLGRPPSTWERPSREDLEKEITGLREAIEATNRRIAEYEADSSDASEFRMHLKNLEQRLEAARLEAAKKK